MSPHGGRREGAGRKPSKLAPRFPIQVLLTNSERAELDAAAMLDEKETSTCMREASLKWARRRLKPQSRERG